MLLQQLHREQSFGLVSYLALVGVDLVDPVGQDIVVVDQDNLVVVDLDNLVVAGQVMLCYHNHNLVGIHIVEVDNLLVEVDILLVVVGNLLEVGNLLVEVDIRIVVGNLDYYLEVGNRGSLETLLIYCYKI